MSYTPNYAMYSKAADGWHDEPFEYVYTFQKDFGAPIATPSLADFLNQPLQLDPDADFYARAIAILIDQAPPGEGRIDFNMRLRDAFGRPLDDGFIPMSAYAIAPFSVGPFGPPAGSPSGTPWFPEMYCPKSSIMWADFQAQTLVGKAAQFYSFHIYFQGVKRFENEECKPAA